MRHFISLILIFVAFYGMNAPVAQAYNTECVLCMTDDNQDDCSNICFRACTAEYYGNAGACSLFNNDLEVNRRLEFLDGSLNPFAQHVFDAPDDPNGIEAEKNHRKKLRLETCKASVQAVHTAWGAYTDKESEFLSVIGQQNLTSAQEIGAAASLRDVYQDYKDKIQVCLQETCSGQIAFPRGGRTIRSDFSSSGDLEQCRNAEAVGEARVAALRDEIEKARIPSDLVGQEGDGSDFTPPLYNDFDDDELADSDKGNAQGTDHNKAQQQVQGFINSAQNMNQMLQPFFANQNQGQGKVYNYNMGKRNYTPSVAGDYDTEALIPPDYTSLEGIQHPEPDLPLPSEPTDYSEYKNAGGAQPGGASGSSGGGAGGFMGAGNNNAASKSNRSGGRRARKKNRKLSIYSSRLEEENGSSSFPQISGLTKTPSRTVSRNRNGQKVDRRFNPSKYSVKINETYQRALDSPAMRRAQRRAAGHVDDVLSSRGYGNWHKRNSIHPKSLSIFKQTRVCYIVKYSTYAGSCGPGGG